MKSSCTCCGPAAGPRLRGHPTLQKVYLWEEVGISETFKNAGCQARI